jgi:hypothetical protein
MELPLALAPALVIALIARPRDVGEVAEKRAISA